MPIDELRKFGGEMYLIDCIEAPFPIQNFLCQSYNCQNVLIGNNNLERKSEFLPPWLGLFFTPTHRVVSKLSKYSGAKSLMSTELKSKNMMNAQVSQRELDDLEQQQTEFIRKRDQLRNKRSEIETTINVMEEQCKTKFQEKSEHQKRIFEFKQLKKKVVQQENKLQRLINEPFDVDMEKEKFSKLSKEMIKKMLKFHENSITVYSQMTDIELNEVKARARMVIFKNGTANFDAELRECYDDIDRMKSYCDRISGILDKTKQQAKEKQKIALKMTENHNPNEGNRFPYKKQFDELSTDREELKGEMDDLEEQINCRSSNDQSVLDEYNER